MIHEDQNIYYEILCILCKKALKYYLDKGEVFILNILVKIGKYIIKIYYYLDKKKILI